MAKTTEILTKLLDETFKELNDVPPPESLLDLNDYCLHHIFSYIINIRERIRLKRVCKRFAEVVTSGLKTDYMCFSVMNLLYPSEMIDTKKKEIIRFNKNVLFRSVSRLYEVHNDIFNYTYDDTSGFLDLPPGPLAYVLKLVIKSRYSRRLNERTDYSNWAMTIVESDLAEFKWLLMRCPRLRSLHVHGLHLDSYDLRYISKRLEHLQLINTTIEISDLANFLEVHCSNLRSLIYCRHTVIPLDSDRTIISHIARHCPSLERLRLQLSYRNLYNFEYFSNLKHLSIEGYGRPKAFYEQVLRNCPNLVECKFTFKTPPTDELLAQWYNEFPNLNKVEVELEETSPLAICAPPATNF